MRAPCAYNRYIWSCYLNRRRGDANLPPPPHTKDYYTQQSSNRGLRPWPFWQNKEPFLTTFIEKGSPFTWLLKTEHRISFLNLWNNDIALNKLNDTTARSVCSKYFNYLNDRFPLSPFISLNLRNPVTSITVTSIFWIIISLSWYARCDWSI